MITTGLRKVARLRGLIGSAIRCPRMPSYALERKDSPLKDMLLPWRFPQTANGWPLAIPTVWSISGKPPPAW